MRVVCAAAHVAEMNGSFGPGGNKRTFESAVVDGLREFDLPGPVHGEQPTGAPRVVPPRPG